MRPPGATTSKVPAIDFALPVASITMVGNSPPKISFSFAGDSAGMRVCFTPTRSRQNASRDSATSITARGAPARAAVAAIEVGLERAAIAALEAMRLIARINNFDAELVTKDARIIEERLLTSEGVEIGPAHADAAHAHQRVAGREHGLGAV